MSPKSQQQREAADKYLKEKVDTIAVRVPKGHKEEIKNHAKSRGESVNAFVLRAIDHTIEDDRKRGA